MFDIILVKGDSMRTRIVNNIKEYRTQLQFCEKQLAQKVESIAKEYGMKVSIYWKTIVAIENGKYKPSLDLAILLAKALESTVEDVFNFD